MKELTARQGEVLGIIKKHISTAGYAPTIREIGDHFCISVKGVQDHLMVLKRKGVITSESGKARTIKVAEVKEAVNE
jgi:repressor LexA